MGRFLILVGIGTLVYDHYYGIVVPFPHEIISIVAYSLVGIGAIMYFLTDLK